jgi:hypothetical protein
MKVLLREISGLSSQTFPKANCHEWNSQINPVLFPQHDGILRVPSIDEVVSIFWDIPFEHVYRSSSRVQLTSTSQETIVRYAIHEEALSRGCLNISQYQSRESFQLLIDRLKPRLIEAGFGHSFRPPRHRSSLDW